MDSIGNVDSKIDKIISTEEIFKLEEQEKRLVSTFKAEQLEKNSKKFWDLFYKRNENRFFKDRHWTGREFEELLSGTSTKENRILLEVGCGVGNFVFPLLAEDKFSYFIYACDFSPRAVELVKSHHLYDEKYIRAFVVDITADEALKEVSENTVDVVTLIFVLSAIHPQHYDKVLQNLRRVLKPDAIILLRDYGLYDMTQLRFKPGHKISENFYMRQDGTRSYFFSLDFVKNLFSRNGFREIETVYVNKRTVNRKEGVDVPRTFIQAKYVK